MKDSQGKTLPLARFSFFFCLKAWGLDFGIWIWDLKWGIGDLGFRI